MSFAPSDYSQEVQAVVRRAWDRVIEVRSKTSLFAIFKKPTSCFCTNVILKYPHFLFLVYMTKNIISTPLSEIQLFQSYSSSSFQIDNPKPNLLNSSSKELTVDIIHAKVINNGSIQHLHVGNNLLNLYVKSRNMGYAQKLFDEISNRDVQSWTILISGFTRIGSSQMKFLQAFFCQLIKHSFANPFVWTFAQVLFSVLVAGF
uniref:Putative Pentatricopeptide repeat-containing protein n=1 Tax=Davidia involucrata TaxID=16924 RepID=A0A5B7BCY2_DAVIN